MKFLTSRFFRFATPAVLVVAVGLYYYGEHLQAQYESLHLQNTHYQVQIGMYELFRTTQADVVMLGNSLTYNANWNEILNRKNIANRGIVGDVIPGYLHRLGYVYKLHPKICFIEGGINDIYAGYSAGNVFHNLTKIVDTVRIHGIIPILQSTLFASPKWHDALEKNKEVERLNERLIEYAAKNNIKFLNINALVSYKGLLRDELTYDGIHLNAQGYSIWAQEVEKVLIEYNL